MVIQKATPNKIYYTLPWAVSYDLSRMCFVIRGDYPAEKRSGSTVELSFIKTPDLAVIVDPSDLLFKKNWHVNPDCDHCMQKWFGYIVYFSHWDDGVMKKLLQAVHEDTPYEVDKASHEKHWRSLVY